MIDSLGWQRVFAALPPEIRVVAFDFDVISATSDRIALTLVVDGWCRPVHRLAARLAYMTRTCSSEAEMTADILRQLDMIVSLR